MAEDNTTGVHSPVSDLKASLIAKYPKVQGEGIMCIVTCKHESQEAGNMIRCCTCAHWFHTDCIDLNRDEAVGVWPYHSCRFISYDVSQLNQTINNLMDVINTQQVQINEITISQAATKTRFAHELKDFHKEHMKLVTQLQEQLQQKETENSDLRRKVTELTLETHSLKWSGFIKKPKDLVLSDSMLGLVDSPKLVDTKLVPLLGGHVHTLKEELMKPDYHGAKFRKVTLMVGTNDLQDAKGEVAKLPGVVEQYKELISNSEAIAEDVTVSSVWLFRGMLRASSHKTGCQQTG